MWLEMLVASRGENLLRIKGILNLKARTGRSRSTPCGT